MGAFLLKSWFILFPAKEYTIVVVGLDNAGKKTTLYKLHLADVVTTYPTVGSNVEELVHNNIRFEESAEHLNICICLRLGIFVDKTKNIVGDVLSWNSCCYRCDRQHYRARITIMKNDLFRLRGHEDLQHSVVLIFANKQDLKDAMTLAEISDAFSPNSIENHDWHIQACCALTGDGLYDSLGWIVQHVTGKAPT